MRKAQALHYAEPEIGKVLHQSIGGALLLKIVTMKVERGYSSWGYYEQRVKKKRIWLQFSWSESSFLSMLLLLNICSTDVFLCVMCEIFCTTDWRDACFMISTSSLLSYEFFLSHTDACWDAHDAAYLLSLLCFTWLLFGIKDKLYIHTYT